MKKFLLPQEGNFYKANLHTHSTISDGRLTPCELKEEYQKKGYSILAITDHDILVAHNDLSDDNFLTITSFETYFNTELFGVMDFNFVKAYHFCFYAKDKNNVVCPAFSEKYIERPHSLKFVSEEMKKYSYDRKYCTNVINKIIKECNDQGFLVSYNHPRWSLQSYKDYGDLEGLWGLEVFNTSAAKVGLIDNDQPFYDFLQDGKTIFPLMGDDMHNMSHAFGGWCMIKAPSLKYENVINAMEKGDFYCSNGPSFNELSICDGIVSVKCSKVRKIAVCTANRASFSVESQDGITEAEIDINKYIKLIEANKNRLPWKPYIRIMLTDTEGNKAYTRAYQFDEITDI